MKSYSTLCKYCHHVETCDRPDFVAVCFKPNAEVERVISHNAEIDKLFDATRAKKTIEVEFPEGFMPPDRFDSSENKPLLRSGVGKSISECSSCTPCPFYFHDTYESYEWCSLGGEDGCPIKQFF